MRHCHAVGKAEPLRGVVAAVLAVSHLNRCRYVIIRFKLGPKIRQEKTVQIFIGVNNGFLEDSID